MAAGDPIITRATTQRVLDPEHGDPVQGQLMRLADVFILGPYMVWTARDVQHEYLRLGMTLLGIGTIIYNGYNLLRIYKAQRGEGIPELAGRPVMGSRVRGLRAPGLLELSRYNVNVGRTPGRPPERRIW